MMEIILAGYNLDYQTISGFKAGDQDPDRLTPETIAAAYARISRDPRPVNELREISLKEVEKARQSNRNIVFAMGHSSIAEHAVFNIDVIGVSRLLVEEIERSRLASYTEKSQRYVVMQDDFVVPDEIRGSVCEQDFISTVREQNLFYHRLYERLRIYVYERYREVAQDQKSHSLLDGWAKEDARYVISLSTETQLGMTINARSMELMIRRLASSSLAEAREFSGRLYETARAIAPSLIRYIEPTDYDRLTKGDLQAKVAGWEAEEGQEKGGQGPCGDNEVRLIHVTPDADNRLVAALLHSVSHLSLSRCLAKAAGMTSEAKEDVVKTALRHMRPYDSVLREFENVDLHFELVVSATCFAQLKRHRMATITCQDYNPSLGATAPPAVCETGMEAEFRAIIARTEETYHGIKKTAPSAAAYILTNAHRRRVSLKVNGRELYHIARLRGDQYAQWDIRQAAKKMTELGRKAMPLTLMLATGKDDFNLLYDKIFNAAKYINQAGLTV